MSQVDPSTIASLILELVAQRGAAKSVCPSEIARRLDPDRWRNCMDEVRSVASMLARQGKIEIAQGGRGVDAVGPLRGPIRLRLRRERE